MSITETPEWPVLAVWIIVVAIDLFVPKTKGVTISPYDAGMFALYLVALAWGATRVGISGHETAGWSVVILAAGLFGRRLYLLFNQRERK